MPLIAHVTHKARESFECSNVARWLLFHMTEQSATRFWQEPVFASNEIDSSVGNLVYRWAREVGIPPSDLPLPRLCMTVPTIHGLLVVYIGWMTSLVVPVPERQSRHQRLGLHFIRRHIANIDLQILNEPPELQGSDDASLVSILQTSADVLRALFPHNLGNMQNRCSYACAACRELSMTWRHGL